MLAAVRSTPSPAPGRPQPGHYRYCPAAPPTRQVRETIPATHGSAITGGRSNSAFPISTGKPLQPCSLPMRIDSIEYHCRCIPGYGARAIGSCNSDAARSLLSLLGSPGQPALERTMRAHRHVKHPAAVERSAGAAGAQASGGRSGKPRALEQAAGAQASRRRSSKRSPTDERSYTSAVIQSATVRTMKTCPSWRCGCKYCGSLCAAKPRWEPPIAGHRGCGQ